MSMHLVGPWMTTTRSKKRKTKKKTKSLLKAEAEHKKYIDKIYRSRGIDPKILGSSAVEQTAVNRLVAGSNPARGATLFSPPQIFLFKPIRPLGSYRFQARAHIVSLP